MYCKLYQCDTNKLFINTHIYILEITALLAISGFTDMVKIVPSVYQGNECIYLDIHAIVFT